MEIRETKKTEQLKNKSGSSAKLKFTAGLSEIFMLLIIAGFAFYVNRSIVIKGLYMDDLYMWSCYGEQSIWEFAFPIGTSTRFRPVYWLATYLQMAIIGTHIDRFVTFNIIINIIAAAELFYIAKSLSKDLRWTGLVAALCYLASRFAYYQIGQALGLMETMALGMSVLVLFFLLEYSKRGGGKKGFYGALITYFLLVFVHERYLSLFPLFYLALCIVLLREKKGYRLSFLKSRENIKKWLSPVIVLAVIVLIRTLAIGKALPAGTGGTEVTDTFSIGQSMRFCIDQVLYILGVNAGPEYLCGLPWADTPWQIKRAVKFSILCIGLLCIIFACIIISELIRAVGTCKAGCGQNGAASVNKNISGAGCNAAGLLYDDVTFSLMICSFIALCIGCSSVTIRLEMRWIYVSYAAALLFASYMTGRIREAFAAWKHGVVYGIALLLLTAYAMLSIGTNIFCRGYFDRIYFWADQERMNSLAEETVEKYGVDGVLGKNIYIIGNSYEMSDFYADTFFKTFDPAKKAEGTKVIFADSLTRVPADEVRDGRALVLVEEPQDNAYRDITEDIK